MDATEPTTKAFVEALRYIGRLLDRPIVYVTKDGRFHFPLGDDPMGRDLSLAVSSETADRVRLEACARRSPSATLWSNVNDRRRLARLILAVRDEAEAAV